MNELRETLPSQVALNKIERHVVVPGQIPACRSIRLQARMNTSIHLLAAVAVLASGCSKPTEQSTPLPAKAMNKYDIISDYGRFECEPGVHIAVDCVSSGQADLDEKNVGVVERKWKAVWPATFVFLKELRKKYDLSTDFTPAGMRAKLMMADTVMSDEARWEVSFTIVDDGYSEWGVAFEGSTIDPDSSQPYF